MRLSAPGGDMVSLHASGYQFPQADDPHQRYSWHLIAGEAARPQGQWRFQYPALTCDESPARVGVAAGGGRLGRRPHARCVAPPKPLTFLEPNLRFRVAGGSPAGPVVAVDLDAEFNLTPQRHTGPAIPSR
jgi:hypothetical protein